MRSTKKEKTPAELFLWVNKRKSVIFISYAAPFIEGTHTAQEHRLFFITHNWYSTSGMTIPGEHKAQNDVFGRRS